MKYKAEILVKLDIETDTESSAKELIKDNQLFLDVCGFDKNGTYSIRTSGRQKAMTLKKSE